VISSAPAQPPQDGKQAPLTEKLEREADQLELAIEALEADQAEQFAAASPAVAAIIESAAEAKNPARRPLPEHLPREEIIHTVPCACPSCGGALRRIGEEITETLDYVPGRFKVIRHVREKLSCRACDTVVAAPAPDHAIAGGRAGAGRRIDLMVRQRTMLINAVRGHLGDYGIIVAKGAAGVRVILKAI
jgi:hypothetical protein